MAIEKQNAKSYRYTLIKIINNFTTEEIKSSSITEKLIIRTKDYRLEDF